MLNPRIVDPGALTTSPSMVPKAPGPFSRTRGAPTKPGCVVASMLTGWVIAGKAELIWTVCGPPPVMLKLIAFKSGNWLATVIASLKVQLPASHTPSSVSAVELTTSMGPSSARADEAVSPAISIAPQNATAILVEVVRSLVMKRGYPRRLRWMASMAPVPSANFSLNYLVLE